MRTDFTLSRDLGRKMNRLIKLLVIASLSLFATGSAWASAFADDIGLSFSPPGSSIVRVFARTVDYSLVSTDSQGVLVQPKDELNNDRLMTIIDYLKANNNSSIEGTFRKSGETLWKGLYTFDRNRRVLKVKVRGVNYIISTLYAVDDVDDFGDQDDDDL